MFVYETICVYFLSYVFCLNRNVAVESDPSRCLVKYHPASPPPYQITPANPIHIKHTYTRQSVGLYIHASCYI